MASVVQGLVDTIYDSPLYARYTHTSELGLSTATMQRVHLRADSASSAAGETRAEPPLPDAGGEAVDTDGDAWGQWPPLESDLDEDAYVFIDYDVLEDVWYDQTGDWSLPNQYD